MRKNTEPTRRTFLWKAGLMTSVPLAGVALDEAGDGSTATSEDLGQMNAIRGLHEEFARLFNAGNRQAVAGLFADGAGPTFDESVRRLSADRFGQSDAIALSEDQQTAAVAIHCTVHMETPIRGNSTLVEMARLQGEGVIRRSEPRILKTSCVQRDGVWWFESAQFRA